MLSIAVRVFPRRLLLLALLACCLFALKVQAQMIPAPQLAAAFLCGGAGQTCCLNRTCNAGLACNSNNICRKCGGNGDICCANNICSSGLTCQGGRCTAPACGGPDQPCCAGTCNGAGLACDFNTNTCRVCGFLGEFCCPYAPQCFEGTCRTPGTCQP